MTQDDLFNPMNVAHPRNPASPMNRGGVWSAVSAGAVMETPVIARKALLY